MTHLRIILASMFSTCILVTGCTTQQDKNHAVFIDDNEALHTEYAHLEWDPKIIYNPASTGTPEVVLHEVISTSTQPAKAPNYKTIRVNFATDRTRNTVDGEEPFTEVPNESEDELLYGTCDVSIPFDHQIGVIEGPMLGWKRLENPEKHMVLLSTKIIGKEVFFENLESQIIRTSNSNAFIFVHGYNVSFSDAALRTAQMAQDLKFEGAAIFYSWPSKKSTATYPWDEQNIAWSEPHFKKFLSDFLSTTAAENVYLVGHSMGTRALTNSLTSLIREKPELTAKLKSIILAAPDIDTRIFKRDIAPYLTGANLNLTLYASSNDEALKLSRKFHGSPRLGDSGASLALLKGIDTIDASHADTSFSFIGHSYYGSKSILSDMYDIFQKKQIKPDNRFGLEPVGKPVTHWTFR
ncbi:alpha/beta hydrolase [Pseudomonas sp. G2-4]|uniref:alpha/beta hydrolase n=1 Tax=Pseudomonas sp. G2-4 TaxID=1506334 RepID=UPI0024BAA19D|nr:alpha/beta hydrolase [Pseudomonas sp. G2-4]WHS58137.1 alpha/beta hydrolase [Pseudomonas sp. G2-4]